MSIVWSFVNSVPLLPQEVQQVRHLLEVGRDVRVVPQKVRVVELQVDDVLDIALRRMQLTTSGRGTQAHPRACAGATTNTAAVSADDATTATHPRRVGHTDTPPDPEHRARRQAGETDQ